MFQSYPLKCSQPQQAEFQTEVLCAQIDFFLGGNLLTNPSAGSGNHAKIVANAFCFASKVVDKLWIGKLNRRKAFSVQKCAFCSTWSCFGKSSRKILVTHKVPWYRQHYGTFQGERDIARISIENSIDFLLFWPEIMGCLCLFSIK